MDWTKIELLLEKYEAGETNLEEERTLKESFKRHDIPMHLKVYEVQFAFFEQEKKASFSENDLEESLLSRLNKTENELSTNVIPLQRKPQVWQKRIVQIAAAVILVAFGFILGKIPLGSPSNQASNTRMQQIEENMGEMKQMLVLSLLKQASASERIKGVNIVNESEDADQKIITALIETLNQDENANVRLAAANALFVYKDNATVKNALIQALPKEEDPVMQIALINMMIALKDKRSKETIEDFIEKDEIPDKVKKEIREKLKAI